MSDNKGIIATPEGRVAYANLNEPRAYERVKGKPSGEAKYGATFLWPKDTTDISAMKATAVAVAKAKWGDTVDLKTIQFPFKDGDKEAARLLAKGKSEGQVAFYRGNFACKASSKYQPKIQKVKNGDAVDVLPNEVYSGMWARAELNFVGQEVDGRLFVTAYLNFVLKTKDGDRFGGRDAKTIFKDVLGGTANQSAGDDDIEY